MLGEKWSSCIDRQSALNNLCLDDALISLGSFMQTKHLCVFIQIWTKVEVGAPWNRFKPSSKIFLLTIPRRYFFCG